MTSVTTMMTMIDGDRIGLTGGTHAMRRRTRRNDARKRPNVNVRKTENESVMCGRNDTGTRRTRSRADSSTTLTKMTVVVCHTGHTVIESGNGSGRKCP